MRLRTRPNPSCALPLESIGGTARSVRAAVSSDQSAGETGGVVKRKPASRTPLQRDQPAGPPHQVGDVDRLAARRRAPEHVNRACHRIAKPRQHPMTQHVPLVEQSMELEKKPREMVQNDVEVAPHMSRTVSPDCTPSSWPATQDGTFCSTNRSAGSPPAGNRTVL